MFSFLFRHRLGESTYEESRSSALLTLFFYSCLMFTVPLGSFFVSKLYLEEEFGLEPPWSLLFPALVAVASVNVVIVAYVLKAFREEAREQGKNEKKDG